MAKIKFYGELAKKFGQEFDLAVDTAGEGLHALMLQIKGLRAYIQNNSFYVNIDEKNLAENSVKTEFKRRLNTQSQIHISPQIAGAGKFGGIILGAVLIVAAIYFPPLAAFSTSIIAAGIGLMANSIVQILTKPPAMDVGMGNSVEMSKSSAFSNIGNRAAEGGCVPIIYGRVRVGSKTISQSIESYRVSV